jgi:hypothetical protein
MRKNYQLYVSAFLSSSYCSVHVPCTWSEVDNEAGVSEIQDMRYIILMPSPWITYEIETR